LLCHEKINKYHIISCVGTTNERMVADTKTQRHRERCRLTRLPWYYYYYMLCERDVHSSFHCSQPFCSPFCCSWWFGHTQNKATTRQPGILCGWSGRLPQSTTGHSFGTDIINVHKHAQDTSVLSFLLHWLTVSRVRAANIVRRLCSDSSHAPYKLSFYYYYYHYYYKVCSCSRIDKISEREWCDVDSPVCGCKSMRWDHISLAALV